ncbi:MAG: hypothetical protein LBK98_05985 [Peptococcaceae bacterium]|jgi:flagellar biosynthesis/type III secretory pathway protein FliH|nr:hypothetical protein [Peptococcaceae bacterium]
MRSLPDIFKRQKFRLVLGEPVLIPDLEWDEGEPGPDGDLTGEAPDPDEPGPDGEETQAGDDADAEEGEAPDGIRAGDDAQGPLEGEALDPGAPPGDGGAGQETERLRRRYQERLRLTRDEFWALCRPGMEDRLERLWREVGQEARQKALLERREEIRRSLVETERGLTALRESRDEFIAHFAKELKYMAIEIAERLLLREISEDNSALGELMLQTLSEIKNAQWIKVEVSEQVMGLADQLREELAGAEQGVMASVTTKAAPPDTLRIVTEDGAVDASITAQIQQLREAFQRAEMEDDG